MCLPRRLPRRRVMKPVQMKRQTHYFCRNCFLNLEDYGQKQCYGCLIELNSSTSGFGHGVGLPFRKKVSCIFESFFKKLQSKF